MSRTAAALAALALAVAPASIAAGGVPPAPNPALTVEVVQTTAHLSQRLQRRPDERFTHRVPRGTPVIDINDRVRFQQLVGFGGAMTDSAAWELYAKLPPARRHEALEKLFGATDGIDLSYLRVPMGASDFTRDGGAYSYDDMPPGESDPSLSHFSIAHDRAYIVPLLREVLAVNPGVRILANPWSAPGWMKANDALNNLDHLGVLLRADYRAFARYFVKFIQAYARSGIHVAAITPQNEPDNPTESPGMQLTEPAEASWIAGSLMPALRAAHLHTKVYGFDLGWVTTGYADELARSGAARELTGIASHCYFGNPDLMSHLHAIAPRLEEIMDECGVDVSPLPVPEIAIASLRNWATTVVLWNMALNTHGGPRAPHYGCGYCTGFADVDDATGTVSYRPMYYQLGQASKFIERGARRIESGHFVHYRIPNGAGTVTAGLDDVAFENPDGSRVLLAYDNSDRPIRFAVDWHRYSFSYRLPAGATVTFIWDRPINS
jgi:glucosylceramidase